MTIELKDVDHLAMLARISISDGEKEVLRRDLGEILAYVSQVKEATAPNKAGQTKVIAPKVEVLRNVMREDCDPHESGKFTDGLLAAAPACKSSRIFVKKIL